MARSLVTPNRRGSLHRFSTLDQIKDANRRKGDSWFGASNNRFFGTRYSEIIIGGRFFVTSEQPPHSRRRYTIREAREDGSIQTVGEVCDFADRRTAIARAQVLADEGYTTQEPDLITDD